jgi:hypothetical protein
MQTSRIQSNYNVGGVAFTATASRSAEGQISHIVDVPAGVAGAISATGADGLTTGHGIIQTDVVDVHWSDPADGSHKVRRGVTIDTAAANAVTFDNSPAAEGDALPAEDTAAVLSKQVPVTRGTWDGDALEMIGLKSNRRACVDFRSDSASVAALKLVAEEGWAWVSGQSVANPFAGETVATLVISNGSTSAMVLSCGVLYQSVE